jgi:MFS family permease
VTGSIGRAKSALRSKDFQRLLLARYLSQFGDGVFQAYIFDKLVFLAPDSQNTAAAVAKAVALLIIPFSLLGPFAGVFIDRWSRRRILVYSPLVKAAAAVPLLFVVHGNGLIYVLALVVVSVNRFYLTTAGAVNPSLVADQDLLIGNAMSGSAGTVITAGGLAIGSRVAGHLDPAVLIAVTLVCWPLAMLLAATIRNPLRADRPRGTIREDLGRVTRELVGGFRRLVATPPALGPVVSVSVDQTLINIVAVLSIVVFKEEFNKGIASYSNIVVAAGFGVVVGMLTVGLLEDRMQKVRLIAMAFAVAGLVSIAVAPVITGPSILFLTFVLAASFPWRKIPADTLVQENLPNRFRGRIFALYDIAFTMPRVLGALIVVLLHDVWGLSTGWLVGVVGVLFLAWTPVLPRWVRRPRFVRVRFYAGGSADEVPRSIVVGGEETDVEVIRSSVEERGATRVRRYRLRSADEIVDIVDDARGDRWRVERDIPLDIAADELTGPPPRVRPASTEP